MTSKKIQKIGKPAGKNDKFEINVVSLEQIFGKESDKTEMVTTNHDSISPLSTELSNGMVIKAFDGGNPNNKIDKTEDAR